MTHSTLQIRGLELCVHLGWPVDEILKKQVVLLDVHIIFAQPPTGCQSDHLSDTYCYSELIKNIRQFTETKEFHLIEFLSRELFQFIKTRLPQDARMSVRITKHPKIPGLTQGVCFSYGECESVW